MSAKCINKIPAGLPDLPPVPAGWDAWEYMGRGWRDSVRPEPWTHFQDDAPEHGWLFGGEFTCDWSGGREPGGHSLGHYIRAVKLPAKKPKAKKDSRLPKGWQLIGLGQRAKAGDRIDFCCTGGLAKSFRVSTTLDHHNDPSQYTCAESQRIFRYAPAAKKTPKPAPRRESRKSRIGTVVQRAISGQFANAMEAAAQIERIYDNSQRAKRRRGGK